MSDRDIKPENVSEHAPSCPLMTTGPGDFGARCDCGARAAREPKPPRKAGELPRLPTRSHPNRGKAAAAFREEKARQRARTKERVDEILLKMAGGLWLPTHSAKEMAEKWGVTVHSVRAYANSASMILTSGRSQEYLEEVRASAVARLDLISVRALADKDWRAAADATKESARLAGVAYAPIRHVVAFVDAAGRPSPHGQALLAAAPRAALDAAFEYLRTHDGDFEGARAAGIAASGSSALSLTMELEAAKTVIDSAPEPGIIEYPPEEDDELDLGGTTTPAPGDAPGSPAGAGGEHGDEADEGAGG